MTRSPLVGIIIGSTVAVGVAVLVGGRVVAVVLGLGGAVAVGVGVAVSEAGAVVAVAVGVGIGSSPPHAAPNTKRATATNPRTAQRKLRFGRRVDFITLLLPLKLTLRQPLVADRTP
jgi:Kef-type K+ transport system membrane component KefB